MLIKQLGPDYVVWDKASTIHFRQPGTTTLYARVAIGNHERESIRLELRDTPVLTRDFHVHLTDDTGNIHASIEKTPHIRRRSGTRGSLD